MYTGEYQSGQMGQTVNLLSYDFAHVPLAEVAQLVEHQPSKLIVASSILVFRSNADEKKAFQVFLKGFFRPPSPKKEKKGGGEGTGKLTSAG